MYMRLFVADDSSIIRERILQMLAMVPNVQIVGEAPDGVEALRGITETNPDMVILDLRMPKVEGFELLPVIKGLPRRPLVMVLTNYATNRHCEVCKKLGADYFFDKSREFEKAIDVVESLARQETQQAIF